MRSSRLSGVRGSGDGRRTVRGPPGRRDLRVVSAPLRGPFTPRSRRHGGRRGARRPRDGAGDARAGGHARGRGHRPRRRVVPQRPVDRVQDERRAWTPSCWPSSRCWKTVSGRSVSRSGPWSSSRPTTALASAARLARDDDRVEAGARSAPPTRTSGQCVEDPKVVQLDRRQGGKLLDEAAVRERFGVGPRSIPDYLALVGDSADGFPGLPGWGAKSTATVLARYEHLAAIPDDVTAWDGRRARRGEAGGDAGRGA